MGSILKHFTTFIESIFDVFPQNIETMHQLKSFAHQSIQALLIHSTCAHLVCYQQLYTKCFTMLFVIKFPLKCDLPSPYARSNYFCFVSTDCL